MDTSFIRGVRLLGLNHFVFIPQSNPFYLHISLSFGLLILLGKKYGKSFMNFMGYISGLEIAAASSKSNNIDNLCGYNWVSIP